MPEPFELADSTAASRIGVAGDEEVTTELVVVDTLVEQVPDDDQDGVGDGNDGLLMAPVALDPLVVGSRVGVLGPGGGQGGLDEGGTQRRGALVVRPVLRLPTDSLLPGQTPAHDASWPGVAKRDMSTPISAMTVSAVRLATPGMVTT